jgi:uncharacterized membrane protein
MSTTVTAHAEVDVPVRVAYDQWTQFESFPHFMSGVESVRQVDDTTTHWVVSIAGVKREFDADISDQVPDDHVAWRSTSAEVHHRGRVDFRPVSSDRTRIDLTIEWQPEGFVEKAPPCSSTMRRSSATCTASRSTSRSSRCRRAPGAAKSTAVARPRPAWARRA